VPNVTSVSGLENLTLVPHVDFPNKKSRLKNQSAFINIVFILV